jgi:uncharacterized membrane protein
MSADADPNATSQNHLRFHTGSVGLAPAFGTDWFGKRAEKFARFFGTPIFLISQTVFVVIWIVLNSTGAAKFDLYPFILLNLAFSTQAAYAAPLILLAQTRQADRDKASLESDALHREDLAIENRRQLQLLRELLTRNTELTELTAQLSARIETLTVDINQRLNAPPSR